MTVEPTIPLKITQGQIVVNSAWVVAQSPDMVVWEIDLRSKYPEGYVVLGWTDEDQDGDKEERIDIHLFAGERTIQTDSSTERPTIIAAKMPDGEHWSVIADWARYTARLCYFKYPESDSGLAIIDLTEEST